MMTTATRESSSVGSSRFVNFYCYRLCYIATVAPIRLCMAVIRC